MGNNTSYEAYPMQLGVAQQRAAVVVPTLSNQEGIILLKNWILPTIPLTACTYFPSEVTMKAQVFQTAVGVDNWGVTLHELAQEPALGGYQLPTPKVWLHAQFSWSFPKSQRDTPRLWGYSL